jgi:hypothetical protein
MTMTTRESMDIKVLRWGGFGIAAFVTAVLIAGCGF